MNPSEVTERLQGLPPLDLEAIAFVLELDEREPDREQIAEMQPQIEAAMEELSDHVEQVRGVMNRCLKLESIPTTQVENL